MKKVIIFMFALVLCCSIITFAVEKPSLKCTFEKVPEGNAGWFQITPIAGPLTAGDELKIVIYNAGDTEFSCFVSLRNAAWERLDETDTIFIWPQESEEFVLEEIPEDASMALLELRYMYEGMQFYIQGPESADYEATISGQGDAIVEGGYFGEIESFPTELSTEIPTEIPDETQALPTKMPVTAAPTEVTATLAPTVASTEEPGNQEKSSLTSFVIGISVIVALAVAVGIILVVKKKQQKNTKK